MDRRRGKPSTRRVPLATVETVLGLYRDRSISISTCALSREAGRRASDRSQLHLGQAGAAGRGAGGPGAEARGASQAAGAASAAGHDAAHRRQPPPVVSGRALARPDRDLRRRHQRDLLRPAGRGGIDPDGDGRAEACGRDQGRVLHVVFRPRQPLLADSQGRRQGRRAASDPGGAGASRTRHSDDSGLFAAGPGAVRARLRHLAGAAAAGAAPARDRCPPGGQRVSARHYIGQFNASFQVAAAERGTAFTARSRKGLDLVFSIQSERVVKRDNTVEFQNLALQIEPVKWRGTLAGSTVTVHRHLDQTLSLTLGPLRLGRYTAEGFRIEALKPGPRPKDAVEKTRVGKAQKQAFPTRLEIPQNPRDSHFPTATATAG
jgi:hypothetical protein